MKKISQIQLLGIILWTMLIMISCGYKVNEEVNENYNPNHTYNDMVYFHGSDIFMDKEDGIYRIGEDTAEELVFKNVYYNRRGMTVCQNFLYFCGSVNRGDRNCSTIYRMCLDSFEVEDLLESIDQTYDNLSELSIYENCLYVTNDYLSKIGFLLNSDGKIEKTLDTQSSDFLYKEYNEYAKLQHDRLNTSFDSKEYTMLTEKLHSMYSSVIDIASCKNMLNMVVVSKYKDEGLRSLYLEHENGEYEYLCDAAHSKYVMVTECGIYYFPDLSEEIWYFDFNTKLAKKVYTGGIGSLEEMNLINYDEEYIYIASEISVGLVDLSQRT